MWEEWEASDLHAVVRLGLALVLGAPVLGGGALAVQVDLRLLRLAVDVRLRRGLALELGAHTRELWREERGERCCVGLRVCGARSESRPIVPPSMT